ncbi:KH_10 domain-containing protein [Meloidogyne graminicola]|uniref:KH_10 domain-containing protein n=1 Tax=Meloidogyne graminicola TaxID=189291 RepID=A0A8S9ZWC8_9BILA|nr:KH_10 domain-containing protein [Meloidogyne graminicola]
MSAASKARFNNRRNSSSASSGTPPSVHSQFGSMFHSCQESASLYNEFIRRNIDCSEQKRRAEYVRCHHMATQQHLASSPIVSLPRQNIPNKVRLTIEVQSSDFCSLHNGREAWAVNDSLSDIIKDTDCMLQFANIQDETSEQMGIFNQVTIIGELTNVDIAMNRIRALCPITIATPLYNLKDEIESKDVADLIRQWQKSEEYREHSLVQFSLLYPPTPFSLMNNTEIDIPMNIPFLVLRASRKDCGKTMAGACEAVTKLLFKERPLFFAYLKIPISQRRMIVGSPEGALISAISTNTNATIHFPSSDKSTFNDKSTSNYYLSGAAGSVVHAVRSIQDISPVRIEFEVENNHLVSALSQTNEDHRELDQFDLERAVIVQFRKSVYEGGFRLELEDMRHSLTLMTSEENIHNLYIVRQHLLIEPCWKNDRFQKNNKPKYLEYLKVLVMESYMRSYIGLGNKVISVCRCRRVKE